jgi:uncharacterized protein (TIGR01244 family)
LIVAATVTITAVADDPAPTGTAIEVNRDALPVRIEGIDQVRGEVFREGRLFISGQPNENALHKFRELGVTVVVNLRTPAEMDDRERVPFDEAAEVERLGMDYVNIPLGGEDHPYDRAAVDRFAAVLDAHPGPVLLHCTVGWRASYLWTAYLILYHDFSLEAALERGEAIAIDPPPLQGLLGRPLTLTYGD